MLMSIYFKLRLIEVLSKHDSTHLMQKIVRVLNASTSTGQNLAEEKPTLENEEFSLSDEVSKFETDLKDDCTKMTTKKEPVIAESEQPIVNRKRPLPFSVTALTEDE